MAILGRLGLAVGVLLLVFIGEKLGKASVLAALTSSAAPIACASAYHIVPLAFYTQSWRALLPGQPRPSFWTLLRLRWMAESINALLPVAQVGGDLVRARRLAATGVTAADAGASTILDFTAGLLSQLVFTTAGLLALAAQDRVGEGLGEILRPVAAGLVFLAGASAALALAILGVHRISKRLPLWRAIDERWQGLAGGTARLDAALRALLRERRRLAAAFGWHLGGWFSQVAETWFVLALVGHPIGWTTALAIESLTATARAVAFFVPGGLGVQEAAVVVIGRHLGLPVESAIALGVVKRMREVVVGLPAVALWAFTRRERAPARVAEQ